MTTGCFNIDTWQLDGDTDEKVLVGAKIEALQFAADKETLRLKTDKGAWDLVAEGDCCSHSWIEHIGGVQQAVGHVIASVEDVEMPDSISNEEYECLRFYGTKIKTDGGELFIEFRNHSNGYYGGTLRLEHADDRADLEPLTADV